jgi:acetoin utilization protein AcuB
MLVKKWMSKDVITVDVKDSLSDAIDLLKRNKIRRLPVMEGDKLVGIVSDRDLKEASPSKVTSLDIWEIHYLLSKIKIKDIYKKDPITIRDDSTIEKAAILLHDNKIGGLPVVNAEGKLVGMLTEHDVFNSLIRITGARVPSYRVSMCIDDKENTIQEICDMMKDYEHKCISILNTYYEVREGKREIIIRFQMKAEDKDKVLEKLNSKYENVHLIEEL